MKKNSGTLAEWRLQVGDRHCRWCVQKMDSTPAPLKDQPLKHYDHPAGHHVSGYAMPQWLYVECPVCGYQWSFRKLGINHIEL